jgi:LAGLIDADG DNA endonuclease family protein
VTAAYQQERLSFTEQQRWFLAGFIEGEGSVCVSIKEHSTTQFGYYVDPEFLLYQHRAYPELLELAKAMFGSGCIFPKQGNERVLVYAITSRKSIAERVVPFLRSYMAFSPRRPVYDRFCEIVEAMERKEHHTAQGMARIVEKAYALNPIAKGKARKRALQQVLDRILRDYTPDSSGSLHLEKI